MSKTYQWYYNGSAIGGATAKTHTLTSGQTDSNLIECRVQVDYGADQVAALAKYVVTAPTVTDDFNRANENLEASANWTDDLGGVFDIVSNQVRAATQFGGTIAYTGATPGAANQFASVVFKSATSVSAENQVGPVIRSSYSGGPNGYWLRHDHAAGTLSIQSLAAGSPTQLDSVAYTASADDVLRIEASGTSIVGKINGATVLTATDGTYSAEGVVRIHSYQDGASDVYDLDDFTQGAI